MKGLRRPGGQAVRLMTTIACLASVLTGLAGASPAAASPSRYVIEKCDAQLPGGGVEGAVFHGSPPFSGTQNCADPTGSIFVVQQEDTTTGSGYWTLPLPPPPGGYVENVTVRGSMCNGAWADAGTVAYAVQGGWALNCTTQIHTFTINSPSGSPGLIYLGCERSCRGAPEAWAGDLAATEVDPVAPKIGNLGGGLLAGAPARGHETVTALAEDEGGGVADLNLRINGQPPGLLQQSECAVTRVNTPTYAGVVALSPTPCPPKTEATWTVDTSSAPFQEGPNTISVCAQDFSTIGAPNESCATRTVQVDNSCPNSPATGENLNVGFTGAEGTTKSLRFGRSTSISGQLLGPGGTPTAGATICISAATEGAPAGYIGLATETTDSQGNFTYKVPPGPNRQLRIAYRHDSSQIEQTLTLDTHARPTLHAGPRRLRNGQRVTLRGRLPEPGAAGRVVVLQAAVPRAHRWITFRKATTGHKGRFKAQYHFTSTTRKIRYRFRAVAPRQTGYPWEQGASRAAAVTVSR